MPGIEEKEFQLSGEVVAPDFFAADVDELVSEIKENLRLSGFKKGERRARDRPSPYRIPAVRPRDGEEKQDAPDGRLLLRRRLQRMARPQTDDAYDMLQELIRNGSLIKEAVRRLQKGLASKRMFLCDSDEESQQGFQCSRSPNGFRLQKGMALH